MESSMCIQTLEPKHDRGPWANRRRTDLKQEGEEDRLSILPDELLTHILSFIPSTKDAIQTSILSPRWKYLWTYIPNLDFDLDSEFPCRAKYKSFIKTVDNFFHLRDPRFGIERFRVLSAYKTRHNPNLDRWTCILISRNIKEINIQLSNTLVCQLPNTLLTCKTLVNLRLFGKFEFNLIPSSSVSLPNLKHLSLNSVRYPNSKMITRLLSGCPILEVLSIFILSLDDDDDVKVLNISAPSLKLLSIYFDPCKPNEVHNYDTIIDAPNLEYLKLYDYGSKYISLNNMSSLVEANLDVTLLEEIPLESGGGVMGVLLSAISHVKALTLHYHAIYSLGVSYDLHLPKFSKLERLEIGIDRYGRWKLLPNLLESMPKLEELVFRKGLANRVTTKFNLSPPEDAPLCLSFHLKRIRINRFYGGEEDELKLVKYMLEKGKVLEKMTICPCNKSKNFVEDIWLESRDELLKSTLGSSACQIIFYPSFHQL